MAQLILPDKSYLLMGIFFEVHNEMGPIYKEKHYVDRVEKKFIIKRVPYLREEAIKKFFPNVDIPDLIPDFILWMSAVVDAKAKRYIKLDDIRQMSRYLDQTGLPLGIIVNFKRQKLETKRIINPKRDKTRWP